MIKQNLNILFKNPKIKASSLTNAIFVCLIISVFCACLVLISHYYNLFNDQLCVQEELIGRNESSFNYLIGNIESIAYNKKEMVDVFDDGILSILEKKNWGFYDILVCETGFKNDTVTKIALVGKTGNREDDLALYVTNYDKPLKLSGNTKVLGKVKIPLGRTEQTYLNGQKGNAILLKGKQLKSDKTFPKIDKIIEVNTSFKTIYLSNNTKKKHLVIVNPFNKETKVIDVTGIDELSDITCKGNIVLKSSNALIITDTALLNDVIVFAPEVEIQSGFIGNIQIVAKEKVLVNEHVSLLYPSSIYLKNDLDSTLVDIKSHSIIAGGIVIHGETHSGALKRFLTIGEEATVIGNVYCYGKTQLKGQVIGSVFTDYFFLKTKSSSYENVILNGVINKDSLPNNFVELPLFENDFNGKNYAVIKEF